MFMARRSGKLLERIGELNKLRGTFNIPLEQDYGADFMGCNESFDVMVCNVTVESDDEELLLSALLLLGFP
jgi:hypothetical protein